MQLINKLNLKQVLSSKGKLILASAIFVISILVLLITIYFQTSVNNPTKTQQTAGEINAVSNTKLAVRTQSGDLSLLNVNDTLNTYIDVTGVSDNTQNPNVSELTFSYDPAVLKLTAINPAANMLSANKTINNTTGKATIDIAKIGPFNFNANENIANVKFQILKKQSTTLSISGSKIGYPNQLDSGNSTLAVSVGLTKTDVDTKPAYSPVFRFLNKKSKFHFYTASVNEKDSVIANLSSEWEYEGVPFSVLKKKTTNNRPVYRFLNNRSKLHFYTIGESEKNNIIANLSSEWTFEGIAYYTYEESNSRLLFRFLHKKEKLHFYTPDVKERDSVMENLSDNWEYEGPSYKVK